ncbi:MAG: hypothetical protein SF069_09585 [Phycisphaerae bacterium]|nr:hypothetical protein [Phycisphaerae bacterium]
MKRFLARSAVACAAIGLTSSIASAAGIEVIYSEITGHPTSQIPGALDASGMPIAIEFKAIEDMNFKADGSQWILRGRANSLDTIDTCLLLGAGTTGNMLAQEAQPVAGGTAPEVYDFFDGVAGFNDAGDFAFGARARNGVFAVKEKVIRFTAANGFQVVATESAPLLGAIDAPVGASGDELLGNSLNGIHLLNDNRVGFVDLSTTNISTLRRPILVYHNAGVNQTFLQSGVTAVGGNVWDSFPSDGFRTTPDGAHYIALGDDEGPTTTDQILVVDGNVVLREGSVIPSTSITVTSIFAFDLLASGDWFSRGSTPTGSDWAVRNGALLAATGAPITSGGAIANWGDTFLGCTGNRVGDTIVCGNTDLADPGRDTVVVFNGSDIVVREGDPIDLNEDGIFDDGVFIGRGNNTLAAFAPNDFFLTDDRILYFIAPLNDGKGNDLGTFGAGGEAFLRLDLNPIVGLLGDMNCDGIVSVGDIAGFVLALTDPAGYAATFPDCDINNADVNGDAVVSVGDIAGFVALLVGR